MSNGRDRSTYAMEWDRPTYAMEGVGRHMYWKESVDMYNGGFRSACVMEGIGRHV